MDHMHMGNSSFRTYAEALAHDYWYIIASLVGFAFLLRLFQWYEIKSRLRLSRSRSIKYPTIPQNVFYRIHAVATAVCRELSYPQLYLREPFSWLCPPCSGKVLILLAYWAMIIFMMVDKAIVLDVDYYERVAFRAAWISITQVPFIFLLAARSNIIAHLVGISYERINWLHRWASRTLLVTATIHGGFFMREWVLADFVKVELQIMPMVKYGIGAWAILVWIFLTSLSPLRRMAYEIFVLQHIAAAAVFLWVLWVHVPSYSQYYISFAIGAVSFDRIVRGILFIYRNFSIRINGGGVRGLGRVGYLAALDANQDQITVITIRNVSLSWTPGQHLYLWIPRLGPLESHPFTISNLHVGPDGSASKDIQFAVQAQSGFTKRIHQYAETMQRQGDVTLLRAFIVGPYGAPPDWTAFETLVLISASTGASFTLPILEHQLKHADTSCVQRIHFILIARRREGIKFYEKRLQDLVTLYQPPRIHLRIQIAITGGSSPSNIKAPRGPRDAALESSADDQDLEIGESKERMPQSYTRVRQNSDSNSISSQSGVVKEGKKCVGFEVAESTDIVDEGANSIEYSEGRPDVPILIRDSVEATGGETSVVVCGGMSLTSKVRNAVAALSDDRAVHKGTGAQGIHLHVEEYCF